MNGLSTQEFPLSAKKNAGLAAASVCMLWASQPPLSWWPVAFVALVPTFFLIVCHPSLGRRSWLLMWGLASLYWLFSLQGLRYAHPAIYVGWFALSAYLGGYYVWFIALSRRLSSRGVPLIVAVPILWVGLECIRNYLITGISACMLGHTMADVPDMIQIADLFGSYGVSYVVVTVNVALFAAWNWIRRKSTAKETLPAIVVATVIVLCTIVYGRMRRNESTTESLATFALIQRNEPVEFVQNPEREREIFQSYAGQTATCMARSQRTIDAVVWPESMFTGGLPWLIADADAQVPQLVELSPSEFQTRVQESRGWYRQRAADLQRALGISGSQPPPELIVGCGVVHYDEQEKVYSGAVHVAADGAVRDWYGKTHLVMIGEYIPIASSIPGLRAYVPRLRVGPGPKRFSVGETGVAPNICIETAVERVTLNQLATLRREDQMPNVIVNVTNDGWFDDTSVIDHHLRCAQLVAVGCRRPILSAANNGPTAWIDSTGRIVDSLRRGVNGSIIATPTRDDRISLYLRIGDWPARLLGLLAVLCSLDVVINYWKSRDQRRVDLATDETV